jgi:DNA-binding LacI/PurR family transcriptional regulator
VVLAVDHYRPQVHAGAVRVARESGWDLDASMARWRSLPQDVTPDGILLTASEPRMLDWAARFSCPVVHMHSLLRMPGKEPVAVHLDYAAAGRMGARHLLETGAPYYAFFPAFSRRRQQAHARRVP